MKKVQTTSQKSKSKIFFLALHGVDAVFEGACFTAPDELSLKRIKRIYFDAGLRLLDELRRSEKVAA